MDPFFGFEMNRLDDDEDDAMAAGPSHIHNFKTPCSSSGDDGMKSEIGSRDSIVTVIEREPQVKEDATSETFDTCEITTIQDCITVESSVEGRSEGREWRVKWILFHLGILTAVIILCAAVGVINEHLLSWISIRCAFIAVEAYAVVGLVFSILRSCCKRKEEAATLEEGRFSKAQLFSKILGEKTREDRLEGRGLPETFPPRDIEPPATIPTQIEILRGL